MSLNKLVGGDCGGNNSLVQLTNIISRDASLGQPLSQGDTFINEFMSANSQIPQTFNMKALLQSANEIEKNNTTQSSSSSMSNMFAMSPGATMTYMSQEPSIRNIFYRRPMPAFTNLAPPSNVQIEYIDESDVNQFKDTATNNPELTESEQANFSGFMSFLQKVTGTEDYNTQNDTERLKHTEKALSELSEKFKDEWDKLSNVVDIDLETASGIPKEYEFTEGNVMLDNNNALELGKEKLKLGDIPGAVLCFEAAVQQQPESVEAWFLLGTTQAENEQDPLAITALKNCIAKDPSQLEAYMTLAAAYTNENLSKHALLTLYNWLKANPKYNSLVSNVDPSNLPIKELEEYVQSLLIKSAQLNPLEIDPGVQTGLGVLFNIFNDHDKAIDCFKTALMVADQDSKLWNKLGATLANSQRSDEAVHAYQRALDLEPGFIRARYNVGITCMNLGAHRQAAEHFLVALNQQFKAKSFYPETSDVDNTSSTIWNTLRMVCSFLGEHEIAGLVDRRNLTELNKFFEIYN